MKRYTQGPCPSESCNSSDAYTTYEDGSAYCYSCGHYKPKEQQEEFDYKNPPGVQTFGYTPHRGLTEKTLRHFGASVRNLDGVPFEVVFHYPNKAMKVKVLRSDVPKKKKYRTDGPIQNAGCFGLNLCNPGGTKTIYITEGEHDAMAVWQVKNQEADAVSVQSSSSAFRDVRHDYDTYIKYDRIVLCFDSDAAGKKARAEVASLFDPSKVLHVHFDRLKDPSEYLQRGEHEALFKLLSSPRKELPEGIIHSFADVRKALADEEDRRLAEYPWDGLQTALKGMHAGEMVLFKGLEGIGKTEIFRAIEHHILKTTDHKIGIIRLEETRPETIRGVATYEMQAPAMMEDSGISDDEVFEAYKRAVKGDEDRLYIQSSFDTDDPDLVLSNIRYLVSGCGCRIIFLDHLSMLVTGMGEEDIRKKLDYLTTRLKKMTVELGFCLLTIMHVNDNGQTRDSRYPPKIANTVVDLERDRKHLDPTQRSITRLVVEKGRSQGCRTGPAGAVYYDSKVTFTLSELKEGEANQEILDAVA